MKLDAIFQGTDPPQERREWSTKIAFQVEEEHVRTHGKGKKETNQARVVSWKPRQ